MDDEWEMVLRRWPL